MKLNDENPYKKEFGLNSKSLVDHSNDIELQMLLLEELKQLRDEINHENNFNLDELNFDEEYFCLYSSSKNTLSKIILKKIMILIQRSIIFK